MLESDIEPPFCCRKPQSCREVPAYTGDVEWGKLCRKAYRRLSQVRSTTVPPDITTRPVGWSPGVISFKCPRNECESDCKVHTLRLSKPCFGHWITPEMSGPSAMNRHMFSEPAY